MLSPNPAHTLNLKLYLETGHYLVIWPKLFPWLCTSVSSFFPLAGLGRGWALNQKILIQRLPCISSDRQQKSINCCHLPAPTPTQHFCPNITGFYSICNQWHCWQNDIFLTCCRTDGSPSSLTPYPAYAAQACWGVWKTGQTIPLGRWDLRPRVRYYLWIFQQFPFKNTQGWVCVRTFNTPKIFSASFWPKMFNWIFLI